MKRILLPFLLAALFAAGSASADATPVKLSELSRSITFREGSGHRGNYGWNGGSSSSAVFDGNFSNYAYQNTAGVELVIPTTDKSSGTAMFVTSFKVGHAGNTQYSLYYTTEAEPADILSKAADPRHWTPIDGATDVQAAGEKTYPVLFVATAVKYVFDTTIGFTPSLGEVEVWGVNPAELSCIHPHRTGWTAVQGTANCTDFGIDQMQCEDCGEFFQRDSSTAFPIGHDYETVLAERGTSLSYGSGSNVCKRCGDVVLFEEPRDVVEIGVSLARGIVKFADLSVSSTGNPDWGPRPDLLVDKSWPYTWPYWYANTKSTSEYVQFDFANAVDLTGVEISVPNRTHTLEFYSVSGGEEELVGERLVEYDSSLTGDNPNQKFTVEFRGVTLQALRIKSNDSNNALAVYEVHPWITVAGAGKSAAVRTRIIID